MWKLRYLAPASLLTLVLARKYDDFVVILLALMAWTGLAMAMRLRPSIASLLSDRRMPTGAEGGTVLVGLIAAYLAFAGVDQLLIVGGDGFATPSEAFPVALIDDLLPAAWALLAAAPIAVQIARSRTPSASASAAAGRGLAGAVPLGIALLLLWQVAGKDLAMGQLDDSLVLEGLMLIPTVALLASFGGPFWYSGLTARDAPPAPDAALRTTLRWAGAGWAVAAALGVLALGWSLLAPGPRGVNSGAALALAYTAVTGALWIAALRALDATSARRGWRIALSVAALLVLFLVSLAPAFTLLAAGHSQKGDLGLLAALLLSPLFVAVSGVSVGLGPRLARRLAG